MVAIIFKSIVIVRMITNYQQIINVNIEKIENSVLMNKSDSIKLSSFRDVLSIQPSKFPAFGTAAYTCIVS